MLKVSLYVHGMVNMERIVEKTLLYDFYGELLTAHQREIYEEVVFNDMSLSEAASEYGISRQGVHDMIRRCDKTLEEYEEKLHLVAQFDSVRKAAEALENLVSEEAVLPDERKEKYRELIGVILREME